LEHSDDKLRTKTARKDKTSSITITPSARSKTGRNTNDKYRDVIDEFKNQKNEIIDPSIERKRINSSTNLIGNSIDNSIKSSTISVEYDDDTQFTLKIY